MNLVSLTGMTPARAGALAASGIQTPHDLLLYIPRRYLDKTRIVPIAQLSHSSNPVTVVAEVISKRVTGFKAGRRLEVIVRDDSGSMNAVFFKGWKYYITQFTEGKWVSLFGTVKEYGGRFSMAHPEVQKVEGPDFAVKSKTLTPVYPGNKQFSKARITNKLMSAWIKQILSDEPIPEFLPASILNLYPFPDRHETFRRIHQPVSKAELSDALQRLKFEEFFLFELSMAKIKRIQITRSQGAVMKPGELTRTFFNERLPFTLTKGQIKALSEIRADLASGLQMNRLLQGDVGAGKTIVAIGAILMAIDSGMQAAMLAPTEILAVQHYHTLQNYLSPLDIDARLLVGGQKAALRRDILSDLAGGSCKVVAGTHAVFQEKVAFHRLGLAVIDEQHRFGVKQRNEMLMKGDNPHLLVMSATPIPRSLAMTIYSDLDISVMKELPKGRKPVKTAVRTGRDRPSVYHFLEETIRNGEQAYIVYPLIEESEMMDLKDATMGFEKLKRRFPELSISLLHGKMAPDEKSEIMNRFSEGETDILVSTTVIEVGVDVPNATVMIIEHAERFGLSQLHQLRGRIGRGGRQSYCILMPGTKLSKEGRYRLQKMIETTDGFEIAEADLKLRGPGDFLGTKQSGLPEFRFGDIVEDRMLLEQAKNEAWDLIKKDPDLELPEHQPLKEVFDPYFKERSVFFGIG
ncbi:MAG TPA: ATP-dependent DNA helicase RecG [Balneolaceae bacterium]|nr:ATP-dependent DNA helicase RecG [Balneolaceae bacterium]